MTMKKIILILCVLLFSLPLTSVLHAQSNANVHVELLDGTISDGTLKFPIRDYTASVTIRDSQKNKHVVTGEQLKRMEVVLDSGDTLRYVAECMNDKDIFGKPKYKGKRIVCIVYEGEKANIYALNMDIPYSFMSGMFSTYAVVSRSALYFKTKDMDAIRLLCYGPTTRVIGGKKHLKKQFEDYPEIVDLIEKEEITYKSVVEDPISFIQRIEKLIP